MCDGALVEEMVRSIRDTTARIAVTWCLGPGMYCHGMMVRVCSRQKQLATMKRALTDLQRKKSSGGNNFSDSILSRVKSKNWEKDEDIAEEEVLLDNKVPQRTCTKARML